MNSELLRNSELENQHIDALITIKLKKDKGSQGTQGIDGTQGNHATQGMHGTYGSQTIHGNEGLREVSHIEEIKEAGDAKGHAASLEQMRHLPHPHLPCAVYHPHNSVLSVCHFALTLILSR